MTEGPWFAFQNFVSDKKSFGFAPDSSRIGDTPTWVMDAETEEFARLIAAAPELLYAAKAALFVLKIVYSHTQGTNEAGAIATLEDAIAKAEGRS